VRDLLFALKLLFSSAVPTPDSPPLTGDDFRKLMERLLKGPDKALPERPQDSSVTTKGQTPLPKHLAAS
jgi:hypothetical protein